jgi:hypothetical protein
MNKKTGSASVPILSSPDPYRDVSRIFFFALPDTPICQLVSLVRLKGGVKL